jgi:hypothetical protein
MREDLSGDGLKGVWKNQSTGRSAMPLNLIRSKARELRAKTRKQLLGTVAGPLVAAFLYGFGMKEFPAMQQAVRVLFLFALGWSVVGLYFLNRGMWSAVMPGDAGLSTGLEFCRGEIERRRDLLRRVLLWSLAPMLLAIATFIAALAMVGTKGKSLLPNALPFMALVVIWISAYFMRRLREQRELNREIDELDDLGRNNSA